ncbi:MAG TPA: TolC family protein [Gemmatimonadales bacterium]|jgi:outer membrane protein TolC|nr:TolC family protein [Gemmatimonadales bacterium]
MRRIVVAAVWALLAAPAAVTQTPGDTLRLTLDAAVRRALDEGTAMRLARADVIDASGQVREALSGALPLITGSVVYTRQFASIYQGIGGSDTSSFGKLFQNTPFGAPNTWNLQLQVTQVLWEGGKLGAGLSAARSGRQIATLNQAETVADVTYQVKQAYWNAVLQGRLLGIAGDNLEQARRQLHQVQLFRQAGTRAEYDLLRAEVDAANQEPAVVQARNAYDLALLDVKRLLNVPAEQRLLLETTLESPDATIPVLATDSLSGPNRPALTAAELMVTQQQELLTVARADRWPTLRVTTTYNEQAFPQTVFPGSGDVFRRGWNGEVKLSFPIFDGFKTSGSVDQARAALLRAQAQRDRQRRQVELDVAQATAEVARTRALLVARRETVRQGQRAQYLAGVRYANGMATQLDVSDARLAAQQAQVNEVQATRDYFVALAQLERALGRPVPVVQRPIEQVAQVLNAKEAQP